MRTESEQKNASNSKFKRFATKNVFIIYNPLKLSKLNKYSPSLQMTRIQFFFYRTSMYISNSFYRNSQSIKFDIL